MILKTLLIKILTPYRLTTYQELIRQYPSTKTIQELKEKCSGDKLSFDREMASRQGDLFKIKWYRVILDEAHKIKEATSQSKPQY